jgi:PAS domain S-box-containing protein
MSTNRNRRSIQEITEELRLLAERSNDDRSRVELLHEVQVYQEELVAQNDELRRAQGQLEEARDRFVELYDFAPNAYITLDGNGIILQLNLTAAIWLGKKRQAIERMPLLGFVPTTDRPAYLDFLRRCRASSAGSEVMAQLALRAGDGLRAVELICRPRSGVDELFVAMIDITDRRHLEAERERNAWDHAALAARVISAQDEERHRIARDLHDNLGQHVTALRLMVQTLSAPKKEASAGKFVQKIESMLERLDAGIDAVIGELRPEALDLGLARAIADLVENWSRSFAIRASVTSSTPEHLRLHVDAETHVYRVLQEALNNISKHARASSVTVTLDFDGRIFVLSVHDDGCGFRRDGDSVTAHRGLGLISMRERAQLAGGTVDIESRPGKGTTIRMRVPAPPRRF